MSKYALRKMIQKFETTGQLGILPGSGRKNILSTSDGNVAIASLKTSVRLQMLVFTGKQQSFFNSVTSSFARYDHLRLWLWGYLKDNIYHQMSSTQPNLNDSIQRHVSDILVDLLRSGVGNMILRFQPNVEHETR
ncbi:uncharacterized protein TNCV_1330811 [Trichonephila clavipes]|uniref:DUF4817 domain-containing protein n=1 Tax=Trichonephila clavipes TaxID=2585209 RepID=A0A8X6R8P9_TRICX|nr:uncharacterized protein TNCV_1330811 [Trichonephila clavipes]